MKVWKNIYKALRGVLFTIILFAIGIYMMCYVLLSLPAIQNVVRDTVSSELSELTGGYLSVGNVEIFPFNEVRIHDVSLLTPQKEKCAEAKTLAARIDLWSLITKRKLVFGYAEVIGLDGRLWQKTPQSPLNIQFLIDAFSSKDKKEPKKYDLAIRTIVVRQCAFSFDKLWKARLVGLRRFDPNHISINNINADVMIPHLSNDEIAIDVRRIAFDAADLLKVERINVNVCLTPEQLSVRNLSVKLPGSRFALSDFDLSFDNINNISKSLNSGKHSVSLTESYVTPADLRYFLPKLASLNERFDLSINLNGNLKDVDIDNFKISSTGESLFFDSELKVRSLNDINKLSAAANYIKLHVSSNLISRLANAFNLNDVLTEKLSLLGDVSADLSGKIDMFDKKGDILFNAKTLCGDISGESVVRSFSSGYIDLIADLNIDALDAGKLSGENKLGKISASVNCDGKIAGKNSTGSLKADINSVEWNCVEINDITLSLSRLGNRIDGNLNIEDQYLDCNIDLNALAENKDFTLDVDADVRNIEVFALSLFPGKDIEKLAGTVSASLSGRDLNNVTGLITGKDLLFRKRDKELTLERLELAASHDEQYPRNISVNCDWFNANLKGNFKLTKLPDTFKEMISRVFPSLISPKSLKIKDNEVSSGDFYLNIAADNELAEFFKLPVRLLTPINITGGFDSQKGTASALIDIPYLQQGKNKLVRETRVDINLDSYSSLAVAQIHTIIPAKKGEAELLIDLKGINDVLYADINVNPEHNSRYYGNISLALMNSALFDNADSFSTGYLNKTEVSLPSKGDEYKMLLKPTTFFINGAEWEINGNSFTWANNVLDISPLRISHENQFVEISGKASASDRDVVMVSLSDFNLDFLFETLDINFVTFGGNATGNVRASGLFSKAPFAETDDLYVANLSYNGSVLGNGELRSKWNNSAKEVEIAAHITEDNRFVADLSGGIWVTRDSLSFDLNADKVDIGFLKPFMAAFSSDVRGRASGNAKLYGTFSDIDLIGRLKADTISMLLDYTNVYYGGSDSVIMTPGRIDIPQFRIYDRHGNSGLFSGELRHRYFHDPEFDFRINDVKNMLCYDTDSRINPDWFGTVYASGSGMIKGLPGYIGISFDMTTDPGTSFSFVLNDRLVAQEYSFLSFTDSRTVKIGGAQELEEPEFLKRFKKNTSQTEGSPSVLDMSLRVTATPAAKMTLVMDPVAGDKISARGNGAMLFEYVSVNDDFKMIGKYTLEEGVYNFSLQDIILKDFMIRPGSSVSFNGDPMAANLDISAAYRVNTNLLDLDKSFATDRDLKRTNVPVDALLNVRGAMQNPEISFDIDLPTLTEDVSRKVKSIISTDDMMSRQIIYLLALNRFYTPEYMGSTSNGGGELASVASSTLSSQLSNIMGQLSDKFTLSPSIRSDKGDFSDMEVDLALSSRLLNNRLLINGNFGYRDRSTSQTTFVGDFDIEYLLTRFGNLRLKAYNHFNDQNYYLRSSLTTQGLGILYRHDFDNAFSFLRRRKKADKEKNEK